MEEFEYTVDYSALIPLPTSPAYVISNPKSTFPIYCNNILFFFKSSRARLSFPVPIYFIGTHQVYVKQQDSLFSSTSA